MLVHLIIQEKGRGGRAGNLSLATLLVVNRNNQFRDKNIRNYQKNNSMIYYFKIWTTINM